METGLKTLKKLLLLTIVFLFPLFFLPLTQEFFITGKLYLLAFGSLFLLLISTLQFLTSKKLTWINLPFDAPIALFLIAIVLSIVISSTNKIQALLNANFGLVAIFALTVVYFYLSRTKIIGGRPGRIAYLLLLEISSFLLSLITIVFFFHPFKNANLPQNLQFLKNPTFTPMGSQLDLAIFLGFFLVLGLTRILKQTNIDQQLNNQKTKQSIIHYSLLIVNLIALSLTLYFLLKPQLTNNNQQSTIILPPFRLSWYAAVEILKNPLTALFGVGVDNFASIFTRVKDLAYNQSSLWQINFFAVSRSTLLHLFSETGLFGLLAFALLLYVLIKSGITNQNPVVKAIILYSLFIILFFPPSLILWFLLFLIISQLSSDQLRSEDYNRQEFDLSPLFPFYLGSALVILVVVAVGGYFLGRAYAAEVYYKKSLDGFAKNNGQQVYDNMRQAIIFNPYIERLRTDFSQVNLLIANNLASKKQEKITDQDRQNISQAIQAAIAEAKAAVALNPQKAGYWENLALVYRNIINFAQGADLWTISAYQRAIVADPQNPSYRLNLGGLYYSLNNFEEASKLFEQAVVLKPDWSNAHYNLAWADYQQKNYQRAVNEMQNVLTLLNPQKDKADYEKAKKDLEEFKKKLPQEEKEASPAGEKQPSQLTLPSPPAPKIEPKIKLPKEASPEAN